MTLLMVQETLGSLNGLTSNGLNLYNSFFQGFILLYGFIDTTWL